MSLRTASLCALTLLFAIGCSDERDGALRPTEPVLARSSAKASTSPTVTTTAPSYAYQGAVNLNVTINGSGFDRGTRASWNLNGVPYAKITVNSTAYVSSSQLVANIPANQFNRTVAADGGNGSYVWIAANDIAVEGTWVWDGDGTGPLAPIPFFQGTGASGASIGGRYQNFGHFPTLATQWEPDNAVSGLQDAAGMGLANWPRGFAGEWNDVQPTDALWYVVEFDAVPEPVSLFLIPLALALLQRRSRRSSQF